MPTLPGAYAVGHSFKPDVRLESRNDIKNQKEFFLMRSN